MTWHTVEGQPDLLRNSVTGQVVNVRSFLPDVHIGLRSVDVPTGQIERVVIVSSRPFAGCITCRAAGELLGRFAAVDHCLTREDACRASSKSVGRLKLPVYPYPTLWAFESEAPEGAHLQVIGRFLK